MNASRRPAPLPRRARAALARYRDAEDIPADVEARIWAVVGSDDAPAPAFEPGLDEESVVVDDRARKARWIGLGLAAAAVLALAWSVGGTIAERRHAATAHEAPMQADAPGPRGHARVKAPAAGAEVHGSAASESSPTEPEAAPVEPDAEVERVERRVTPRPRRAGETSPAVEVEPPAPSPTSTLAAERALIAQAWRALAAGDTAAALEAVAEHARRFDAGLLAPEREAVETIADCRRGAEDGSARAQAFHRAHPRSPLAARVDEACGTAEEER